MHINGTCLCEGDNRSPEPHKALVGVQSLAAPQISLSPEGTSIYFALTLFKELRHRSVVLRNVPAVTAATSVTLCSPISIALQSNVFFSVAYPGPQKEHLSAERKQKYI